MRTFSIVLAALISLSTVGLLLAADTDKDVAQREAVRKKLQTAAKAPAFQAAVKQLEQATGAKGAPLETSADGEDTGGVAFTVKHAKADELLGQTRAKLLAQGVYLIRNENGHGLKVGNEEMTDVIAILPTKDKYEVLLAVETEGPNSDHYNSDIVKYLKALEKTHPFDLTEAGDDFLAVKLKEIPKDAEALATKTAEFCDTKKEEQLKNVQKGVLFLWWD